MSNSLAAAARLFAICALYPVWAVTALLSVPLTWITGLDLDVADWSRKTINDLKRR